jgi:hypothetical protein
MAAQLASKPPKGPRPPLIKGAPAAQQVPKPWQSLGYAKAPPLASIPNAKVGHLLNYARMAYDAAKGLERELSNARWNNIAEAYAWAIDAMNALPAWPTAELPQLGNVIKAKLAMANRQATALRTGKPVAAPGAPPAVAQKKPVVKKKAVVAKKRPTPTAPTLATEVQPPGPRPTIPPLEPKKGGGTGIIVGVGAAVVLGIAVAVSSKKRRR